VPLYRVLRGPIGPRIIHVAKNGPITMETLAMECTEQTSPSTPTVHEGSQQEESAGHPASAVERMLNQVGCLKHSTAGMYFYGSLTACHGEKIGPEAYKTYVVQLLKEAGDPSDPVERMLVEQLALAHHNVGRLHIEAARAEGLEQAKAFNAAAARLMNEFRHSALALKSYRAPTVSTGDRIGSRSSRTAADGRGSPKSNGAARNGATTPRSRNSKLDSERNNGHANRITEHLQESAPGRSR